ncbi:MAG: transglycosylase SLT domain-containing protein [Prevotella sp.]|nr:transglycosylase SLT domain-containing protein [Prevotella sp.]
MRKGIYIHLLGLFLVVTACTQKQPEPMTPWGGEEAESSSSTFDLEQIVSNGELIALALSGPETFYDYRGKHLGTEYMLCQRFTNKIGVSLRIELCRDSAEMERRLKDGEADLILFRNDGKSKQLAWHIGKDKPELTKALKEWYRPQLIDEVRKEEDYLLSSRSIKRRVFAPMLNAKGGVISHYDGYFQQYCRSIRWDWRLMAAQCYQESTFDPQARSWAGACGLMQIMPSTADHLGLARDDMFNPEKSIAAAAKLIGELDRSFSDIRNHQERIKFILAAYNGGANHVRDAMALARKNGRDPQRWADVSPYILLLAQPEYYNDPVVKYGYMRGSETAGYVDKIMQRWNGYRGVKSPSVGGISGTPQRATHQKKKFKI